MKSFLGAMGAVLATLTFASASHASQLAYVYGSTNVMVEDPIRVIDLSTMAQVGQVPAGPGPSALYLSQDVRTLFVAHRDGRSISAIDTSSGAEVASIALPFNPTSLAASSDGSRLVALLDEEGAFPNRRTLLPARVAVIDTQARRLLHVHALDSVADSIAVSPDGRRIFAPGIPGLRVLDADTGAEIDVFPGVRLTLLTMDTLGRRLYGFTVAAAGRTLAMLDLESREVATLGITISGNSFPLLRLSPKGDRIFVGFSGTPAGVSAQSGFHVVELPAYRLRGPYRVGADFDNVTLADLRTNADGTRLYATTGVIGAIEEFETDGYRSLGRHLFQGSVALMAVPLDAQVPGAATDLWWNSSESGWGMHLTQRRDIIFAAWFTYDASGYPKWYVASACRLRAACAGCLDGASCTGELYEVGATAYFGAAYDASRVVPQVAGSVAIRFAAAGAMLETTVGGVRRELPISRQLIRGGSVPPAINYTDLWWNPLESGWGLGISHQYDRMFLAWFVYDGEGKPRWYVVSDCAVSAAGDGCSGSVYSTTGPPPGPIFDPNAVRRLEVGTASLRFSDRDSGILTYTVDGVSGSRPITRQKF